jgi:hypothetical protein
VENLGNLDRADGRKEIASEQGLEEIKARPSHEVIHVHQKEVCPLLARDRHVSKMEFPKRGNLSPRQTLSVSNLQVLRLV